MSVKPFTVIEIPGAAGETDFGARACLTPGLALGATGRGVFDGIAIARVAIVCSQGVSTGLGCC